MTRKGRGRLRALSRRVQLAHPQLDAPDAIDRGLVRVDGRIVTNPRSLVADEVSVTLVSREVPLRGEAKLEAALATFTVDVRGRVALDLGASAGGFTRALLRAGVARVYAVDAGYGQLLGSLRQDPRVVALERTNLGALSVALVPDEVDVVTADLSYVPLAVALPQLTGRVRLASEADLIALIKPMYELGLASAPTDAAVLGRAVERAAEGARSAGWEVRSVFRSPVTGQRGAIELFLRGAASGAACAARATAGGRPRARRRR